MFWQFNLHPTIDTMLTREDCTLGEILDEDDVLQETKSQNRKLIDFFLRPEILEELVDLVLQSPDESKDDCVKYKHANTACEVLTADVYAIIDKLTNNEDLLNKIWSFMEAEPPLNPLLASFFSKVMGVLISRKTSLDAERLAQGNAHQALGSFRRAIDYYIKSLNIAKKVNDKAAEGHACGNLGNAYRALGDFRKAIKYHEKELNIAIEVGDRAGEGRAHCNLGNAYQALDNFKTAIEFHKKDLKIAKEVGNRAGEGRANGNLGNAYWSLGDFRKAIEYHRKDLNIAEEVGDRAREGRAYANLGNASYSLGAFRKAIEFYEKRLTIVIGVGDRAGEGGAYGNLGVAYYSLGDFQKSIDYHKKLLSIAKEVGDRAGERRAYFNLSNAYQALGNTQKASKYHKKFSNIAKQPGNLVEEGSADSNLSKAHKSHGDIRETTECHEEQSNNAREVGDRTEEGVIHSSVGGAHSSMSDLRKDAGYYEVNRLTSSKELDGRAREEEIYLRHCDPLASEAYNRALSKGKTRVLPKEINLRGPLAVEAYNKALSKGKTRVRRIPVMLIGQDRSGKTSLKNSLTGIRFNPDESSTVGIDVDPSFFKVTTEIWKTGETDQEANTKDASFYEQHAAWLVVKNLREGELIPEENSVESVHSEDSFLVDMVTPNTNTMSEGSSVSSREFIKTGHDEFPLDKQLDVSAPPRASRISDSDDGSNVYNTPANQRTDPTNRGSNHLTTSKIPDEVETLIKKLLKEVDKVKGEDDIYSVLWDFGGQSVYYATHPLFLTSRALYLLVYDLSRDPHKTAQPVTKQGMYKKIQDRFETKSNLDCLDFWMTSIASLARRDGAHTKESDSKSLLLPEKLPPVFLVCTNADRPCGGAEPFALAREVYGYLQGKSFKVHLCDDVFVVDNTKSGGESECPEVARLRHSILAVAQELPLMKEEIPIKWLKYEKALQVTLGEGHKWIYLEHARQIAAEVCQIYDNEEFVTLLDFLHDQRILIHFDDTPELNKLVVLDPQWLIDVFKKVITVQLSDCHGKAEIKQLWHKLETAGIIEETLLKHVWNPLIGQHETYESFIAIMEKFGLLCSWPSSDTSCNNKQYLVPSMLMVHPPQDITELIASAELPSLFLKFEPGHVPRSLFPRLVLQFFQWSQNEVWSLLHPQLYKNFARFYTAGDEDCSVILLCHSSFIEIVVHRGNVNPRLLEGIQSKLTISSGPEHESFEVFCARAVYRQLSLMLECMRREFCWLRNMTYQAGFICPVCCHRKVVNYCRTHHKQHCEQEECLHFLSESELHNANQFIICTRAAAAVDNKVHVKTFSAWFISPSEQTTTDEVDGRRFLSGEGGEDRSLARLPSDVVESLASRSCDPKEIVLQLKESLHLDERCLGQPNPETKRTIRCLAKSAKFSNRMEVVKYLREITPAGTTGPLLPGKLDIRKIPVCQMRELTMNLSGGEEWKDVAEKLGLTSTEIRYLDKRTLNPCDAALAFISQRCHINVDDLYDALTDCGYPVLADTL